MRHLEKMAHEIEPKEEYFDDLIEIKEEFPPLILDSCDIPSDNYLSDDCSLIENSINLELNHISDSDDCEINTSTSTSSIITTTRGNKKRKNRRKSLLPQKAVKSQTSLQQDHKNGNTTNLTLSNLITNNTNLQDSEDLLRDIDINEDDIFKDLQEQVTEGENFDEEILDNVKEEWRAHWGIKCNMCEQVFPYKTEFDKHYQESYGLVPIYTCTFCNKTAEKYSTFRSHCYRHITEGRYKCQECPKGFSLQSMLHIHVLAKHTKAKPFKCIECGKRFVTKPGLKIHLKKHKTEIKEDYPCVECGKILHTRGGLTSHMNVHRLGRRFMCDVCGKTFTQKVNMQQHVKQHTGDKPHGCDKCGKTFAEKSHLARHYSFHSDQRPYKCEVCQKMYKTERCLKVHSLVHASARPFVCTYCNKGFLSSTKLKQHYNIHTGERPYKCKYCERTFTNYPNWLKHTRRRHKVDHKTGEGLETKPKEEEVPTPAVPPPPPPPPPSQTFQPSVITEQQQQQQQIDNSELISDISLMKTEELLIQQGLLNFPLNDDKFQISPQQMDFLAGSSTMGVLVPYFQTTLPNHQTLITNNTVSNVQFNDLIHSQYLQQSLL